MIEMERTPDGRVAIRRVHDSGFAEIVIGDDEAAHLATELLRVTVENIKAAREKHAEAVR
jgi:hypothetical protein